MIGWVALCLLCVGGALGVALSTLGAGLGLAWLVWAVASPTSNVFLPVVWRGPPDRRAVALTFDDGPDPEVTPRVLALLRAYQAKATFFVVGERAARHPDLLRAMVEEGHEVGTHTMHHRVRFHLSSTANVRREIIAGIQSVRAIIGRTPLLFRPPQGLRSPLAADAIAGLSGVTCVTWTARGLDSLPTTAKAVIGRLESALRPGAILTMHDGRGLGGGHDREPTVTALEALLVACRERQLRCETVSEVAGRASYGAADHDRAWDDWLGRQRYPWAGTVPFPLYWLYRAMRTALVASAFAFFWIGAVGCAWLALPMAWLWPGSKADRLWRGQRLLRTCFRVFHAYMRLCRLVEVRVEDAGGGAAPQRTQGRVLVANHTTLVDMTAIVSALPGVVCVAKSGYANNALMGRVLRLAGFVAAGEDLQGHADMLAQCAERLRMGFDVLVFPEGTRSPPGSLHRFRRGAFEVACRTGASVGLIFMQAVPSALTKGLPFWRHPDQRCRLTISLKRIVEPVEFQMDSRALLRAVEANFREYLDAVPVSHRQPGETAI